MDIINRHTGWVAENPVLSQDSIEIPLQKLINFSFMAFYLDRKLLKTELHFDYIKAERWSFGNFIYKHAAASVG